MISSSDVPACPACACREVHAIPIFSTRIRAEKIPPIEEQLKNSIRKTFYSCKNCGADRTSDWEDVREEEKPEPENIIGPPGSREKISREPILAEDRHALGIAAQLKNGELQ